MRFHVLATDYDGTVAERGVVAPSTLAALERLRASGRRLVLVTGREIDDLERACPRLDLFDRVVGENGAVVYDPATRELRALAAAPPDAFARALRARGVTPLSVGHVIVATRQPHEVHVLETIRELGLELQVIFNKGAVMVLPSGINKATGLRAALDEMQLSPHDAVAVGDAENDHAFLELCECAVAVANALPALAAHADLVTAADHGRGVEELAERLMRDDLADLAPELARHDPVIGTTANGAPVRVPVHGPPVLVAGPSGAGKSTLVTALLEELADAGYQFCLVDPEGDYSALDGVTVVGDAIQAPSVDQALDALARPQTALVINLLGVRLADRPAFFAALAPRLEELRARTGRPHWIAVDEAHHLLPAEARPSTPAAQGLLLVTVHPEHVAPALLAEVGAVVAVGGAPADTLAAFAAAVGAPAPSVDADVAPGEVVVWGRAAGAPPLRVRPREPRTERRRHVRKYAAGELGPDRSFYFRGPDGRLNLRAQNLQIFLQVADGVDDATWMHHLRQGDYSGWFRDAIKDAELAGEAAAVERDAAVGPASSRQRIRAAVERRYTAPA
jgi:HAD superfamily hydrolase (TIGR01484 family)